jgi:putative ABC transport system permease protein
MRFGNILKIAVRSLCRNKMRSFLTMLGVIIGVAAVIAMLAVGQGARDMINSQIAALGTNVLLVFPGAFTQGGVRMSGGGVPLTDGKDKRPSESRKSELANLN